MSSRFSEKKELIEYICDTCSTFFWVEKGHLPNICPFCEKGRVVDNDEIKL